MLPKSINSYLATFSVVILLFFIYIPLAKAAIIFSDSFQGGYNSSQWNIIPGEVAPIQSSFGIIADPQFPNFYSGLYHVQSFPGESTIKFDIKINGPNVSDFGIFVRDTALGGNWKSAYLFGTYGYGGNPNVFLLRESNVGWNQSGPWKESIGNHHFEVAFSDINNSITLKEDDNTLGSWTSSYNFPINEVDFGIWGTGSEFANFQFCDGGGCPTPSPTPTPPPTTKVVVVPGYFGSWNQDAILGCTLADGVGTWSSWLPADYVYNPLLAALGNTGLTVLPFYYDWRREASDSAMALKEFINSKGLVSGERVDLVSHSFGGLVSQAYLEKEGLAHKIDKLLTAGAPHHGTVLAYPPWSGGEIWNDNLLIKTLQTIVLKWCGSSKGLSDREVIQSLIPSTQNLLPTIDYLKDKKSTAVKSISSMFAKNNWLLSTGFSNFYHATVGILSGTGFPTLDWLAVRDRTKHEATLGNWEDGNPVQKDTSTAGDGTVLNDSSVVSAANARFQINQDHLGLMSSSEGINTILSFLGLPTASSLNSTTAPNQPKSTLIVIGYPGTFWVFDPDGKLQKDKGNLIGFLNPKAGKYRLFLIPKTAETRIAIAQFLENGQTLWKEYRHEGLTPKFGTISFDPDNPIEDALK